MKTISSFIVFWAVIGKSMTCYKYNTCSDLGSVDFDFVAALTEFENGVMYVALTPGYNCTELVYSPYQSKEILNKLDKTTEYYAVKETQRGTIQRKNKKITLYTTAFLYHKGHTKERTVLCSYTCDEDGIHVSALQCLVKSKSSKDAICLINSLFIYDINPDLYRYNNQEIQFCRWKKENQYRENGYY